MPGDSQHSLSILPTSTPTPNGPRRVHLFTRLKRQAGGHRVVAVFNPARCSSDDRGWFPRARLRCSIFWSHSLAVKHPTPPILACFLPEITPIANTLCGDYSLRRNPFLYLTWRLPEQCLTMIM